MKTIGLLGGMAWPSTLLYYIAINKKVEQAFGKKHSAQCIIYSYDFDTINPAYCTEQEIKTQLLSGVNLLRQIDFDLLLICSNTMHYYADQLKTELQKINLLDIRDCIGIDLKRTNAKSCLLLGTKFTMESSFYRSFLSDKYDITTIIPALQEMNNLHRIIFEELVNDHVTISSTEFFSKLINNTEADTIILACTELQLLFQQITTEKTIIDSTEAHVNFAIDYLMSKT
jgi:aspartate racemase